jgi:hypothetical protein
VAGIDSCQASMVRREGGQLRRLRHEEQTERAMKEAGQVLQLA